ncbi:MAG: hypothetical protein ACREIA_23880 [Opitutaceae bacterium]
MTPPPDYCPPIDENFKRKLTALVAVSYTILGAVFCMGVMAPLG